MTPPGPPCYHALGRVVSETRTSADAPTIVLAYTYDGNGNRTQVATTIADVDDAVTDYTYDNLGRVTRIQQHGLAGGNAVAEKRIDFTYDAASQYDTIKRYAALYDSGDPENAWLATADYDYDTDGRLVSLTYSLPAGSDDAPEYDWTFDAAGRMTQMVSALDGTADYTNDLAGQLIDADYNGYQTDESYTYDAAGNRLLVDGTTSYTTGDANQLTSDGTFTYSYDPEGNRTARWVASNANETEPGVGDTDITIYAWDNRDRLVSVKHYADFASLSGDSPNKTVTYTYDFQNRWLSETVTEGESVQRAFYVYDGTEVIAQFEKSATGDFAASDMTHRELWNPQSVDQLFAEEEVRWDGGEEEFVTDQLLWALTDHQNTVRDLATYDAMSEETTIAAHRVFDAYGNVTAMTGTAESIFGYTGRPFDEATGLQNNLNRWYDAITGRWLSEDLIAADINLYRYVGNDPLISVDPSGLKSQYVILPDGKQIKLEPGESVAYAMLPDGTWSPTYIYGPGGITVILPPGTTEGSDFGPETLGPEWVVPEAEPTTPSTTSPPASTKPVPATSGSFTITVAPNLPVPDNMIQKLGKTEVAGYKTTYSPGTGACPGGTIVLVQAVSQDGGPPHFDIEGENYPDSPQWPVYDPKNPQIVTDAPGERRYGNYLDTGKKFNLTVCAVCVTGTPGDSCFKQVVLDCVSFAWNHETKTATIPGKNGLEETRAKVFPDIGSPIPGQLWEDAVKSFERNGEIPR